MWTPDTTKAIVQYASLIKRNSSSVKINDCYKKIHPAFLFTVKWVTRTNLYNKEDVEQQLLVHLINQISKYDKKRKAQSFFTQIARNKFIDIIRKERSIYHDLVEYDINVHDKAHTTTHDLPGVMTESEEYLRKCLTTTTQEKIVAISLSTCVGTEFKNRRHLVYHIANISGLRTSEVSKALESLKHQHMEKMITEWEEKGKL